MNHWFTTAVRRGRDETGQPKRGVRDPDLRFGLGGYLWGHNVGHRLATQAVLAAVQNAPARPTHEPTDAPDREADYVKVLEDHNAELLELIDHLRKDIAKLEAIIRELRRPVPKNASLNVDQPKR